MDTEKKVKKPRKVREKKVKKPKEEKPVMMIEKRLVVLSFD